jgi:hypothetical protein
MTKTMYEQYEDGQEPVPDDYHATADETPCYHQAPGGWACTINREIPHTIHEAGAWLWTSDAKVVAVWDDDV